MSVAELQAALARLCTDSSFRRLFELEPDDTLASYTLDEHERETLKAIDRKMLDMFAHSLKSKRLARVRDAYQLVFGKLDHAVLSRYYDRFYELHPAFPGDSDSETIRRFGEFLESSVATDPDLPFYAADLVRYERLYLAAARAAHDDDGFATINDAPNGRPADLDETSVPALAAGVVVGVFQYDLVRVLEELAEGGPVTSQEPSAHAFVFRRPPKGSAPDVLRVSAPVQVLLDACDGRRTANDLVAECERRLGTQGLAEPVMGMLDDLATRGLVTA